MLLLSTESVLHHLFSEGLTVSVSTVLPDTVIMDVVPAAASIPFGVYESGMYAHLFAAVSTAMVENPTDPFAVTNSLLADPSFAKAMEAYVNINRNTHSFRG